MNSCSLSLISYEDVLCVSVGPAFVHVFKLDLFRHFER